MKKVSRSAKTITARLFVQMCMESHAAGHTLREFADRIGMPYRQAYSRYFYYRRRGVDLPALKRAKRTLPERALEVGELNMLVDRMLVVPADGPAVFGGGRRVPVTIS